jgi:hypothetical protein
MPEGEAREPPNQPERTCARADLWCQRRHLLFPSKAVGSGVRRPRVAQQER